MVCEVKRHVPDPNFKKGIERVPNLHQLVTKRLKTVYVFSLHLFKSFDFLVLSPFRRDKQLFIEGEIDHEQGEGVDARQLPVLKLLDQYLLQMLYELNVVLPVATRHFGLKELHERF